MRSNQPCVTELMETLPQSAYEGRSGWFLICISFNASNWADWGQRAMRSTVSSSSEMKLATVPIKKVSSTHPFSSHMLALLKDRAAPVTLLAHIAMFDTWRLQPVRREDGISHQRLGLASVPPTTPQACSGCRAKKVCEVYRIAIAHLPLI